MMTSQRQSDRLLGYFISEKFTVEEVDDLDDYGWLLAASNAGIPLPQTGLRLWTRNRLVEVLP